MLKKSILIFGLLFSATVYSQTLPPNSFQSHDLISNYKHLSAQQLYDTANYYFNKNSIDTAFVCYNLFINIYTKNNDIEQQKRKAEALNRVSVIYYYMCDFRSSYELLIKALLLCEKYDYASYKSKIYINIGNIYYRFNNYDFAKWYYSEALNFPRDSTSIVILLNNLGSVELETGNLDSAYLY